MEEIKAIKDFFSGETVINSRFCAGLAFVLFFSYRGWFAIFRLSRSRITILLSIAVIYVFLIAAAAMSEKRNRRLMTGIFFVAACAGIFFVTWLIHPEYGAWYFDHPDYNLVSSVFYPTGGLCAFLFLYQLDDPEEIRRNLRYVAWIMFAYAIYQLIPVILHGHWNKTGASGDPSAANTSNYNLTFGYRTMVSLVIFWTEYRRTRDKKYLVLSGITFLMVLMFGGRGTLLAFVLFLGFRYLAGTRLHSRRAYLTVLLALLAVALVYTGLLQRIIAAGLGLFSNVTFARSLQKILDGSFFEDAARLRIWGMALNLIRSGGIFGHGPYGDRMLIGKYYSWGYCHDIFLELMVDFGLFGFLFILLFVAGIVRFLMKMEPAWKDILLIFLGLGCQLLVSDSFWYNSSFWAVLALLIKHRKRLLAVRDYTFPGLPVRGGYRSPAAKS